MHNKSLFIFLFLLFTTHKIFAQADLYINEIMASNHTTIADQSGEYEDWIEIYNAGQTDIDLAGFYITDNLSNPQKFHLDSNAVDLVVPAGGYLLIWASGDASRGSNHTDFRLSSAGEAAGLYMPDGETVIDSITFGYIPTDVSFGRYQDSLWRFFTTPTPGTTNTTQAFIGILPPLVFEQAPGFYSSDFQLEITHPVPGVSIHYTLDGAKPDDSAKLFTSPIQITDRSNEPNDFSMIPTNTWASGHSRGWNPPNGLIAKGTTVRARASHPDYINSQSGASYFVFPDTAETYSFPVISFITDKDGLFDGDTGIYVPGYNGNSNLTASNNYAQRGMDWEREGVMHLFSKDGQLDLEQTVGLRIHGGYSRNFPQKSLRVYARSLYGERNFEYQLFPDEQDESYRRFILRNSGNDWNMTMFRDGAAQSLVSHLNMDVQAFRPTIVFINGEYWGIHNIRERYDRHYLERVYGIDPENVDLLSRNSVVKEGDSVHYFNMRDFVENHDLSDDSLYQIAKTMIDVDNFMDYNSVQIYFGNTDWPQNNIDYWRLRVPYDSTAPSGHDGRWRWMMFDVDRSLGYAMTINIDMMPRVTSTESDRLWATFIMRNLLENEQFKREFINRMADHMNTVFTTAYITERVDSFKAKFQPEIAEHIDRWRRPHSVSSWNSQVNSMYSYAQQRPNNARSHIRNFFNINKNVTLNIDVSDDKMGYVWLNSFDILASTPGVDNDPYPWSGIYFHQIPVKLKANPMPGYKFIHWEVDGDTLYSQNITLNPQDDMQIKAVFDIDPQFYTCSGETTAYVIDCPYLFTQWDAQEPAGSFPPAMQFVYFDELDPELDAEIEGIALGAYNLDNRTRIVGLDSQGVGFINTSNTDGNPGFPGRKLGGALLTVNTTEIDSGFIQWTGGTVIPQSRVYHLRLQYRIGDSGPFSDFTGTDGNPVEYQRSEIAGHDSVMGPYPIPEHLTGEECVQFLWRYYYTGERLTQEFGARDLLRLDDIFIGRGLSPDSAINVAEIAAKPSISGPSEVDSADVVFYHTTFDAATTFVWEVSGGEILDGQFSHQIEVSWNNPGNREVKLKTEHQYSCQQLVSKSVLVLAEKDENGNGEEPGDTTNVIDLHDQIEALYVFPNPNQGSFTIEVVTAHTADYKLKLLDLKGRTIHQKHIQSGRPYHFEKNLASGIYFIRIQDVQSGAKLHERIVVQ